MKNTVTREEVLDNMKDVITKTVIEFEKPTTYVTVKMKNGFTLRESATCVDPNNYDEEIGKDICLRKIEDKIWFLLGYALQDKLSKEPPTHELDEFINNLPGDNFYNLKVYDRPDGKTTISICAFNVNNWGVTNKLCTVVFKDSKQRTIEELTEYVKTEMLDALKHNLKWGISLGGKYVYQSLEEGTFQGYQGYEQNELVGKYYHNF